MRVLMRRFRVAKMSQEGTERQVVTPTLMDRACLAGGKEGSASVDEYNDDVHTEY